MACELSVIIPAYNEEDSVISTYNELNQSLQDLEIAYEIIFVDDGSTDNTAERIRSLDNNAILIQHPVNRGYGAALKSGIRAAKGTFILITDADGTYPHTDIPRLWEHAKTYDMVVGSRTGEDVKVQLYRKPAKWLLNHLANYLSGYKIPDLNSGFRIFKREDSIKYFNIICDGFSFTTTITLSYLASGRLIKYVPINYFPRVGNSKIKPFKDGLNFILLIITATTYFNPMKVFIPISAVFLVAGLITFVYSALILGQFMNVTTTIFGVAAIQTALFGLLADLIVKRCS